MNKNDIIQQRLSNQHLVGNPLNTAEEVVSWLGPIQAQDYFGAKWAVGQRVGGADEESIKKAFDEGKILRTHIMRPTWHFVLPADIRWIQELTAPRVHVVSSYMHRQLELDDATLARSNEIIAKALAGGQYKTRQELSALLEQAGIAAQKVRLAYLVMWAELDALICSGPKIGKQFTYALLEERAPEARSLPQEEALGELTRRYFTGHGPAELEDFVFWSGLTKTQARKGLEMNKSALIQETIDGRTYWFAPDLPLIKAPSPTAYLLPNYDEYLVSYRKSDLALEPGHGDFIDKQNTRFAHFLVIDGRLLGTWRRDFEKDTIIITIRRFTALSDEQEAAIRKTGKALGRFLGLDAAFRSTPLPK